MTELRNDLLLQPKKNHGKYFTLSFIVFLSIIPFKLVLNNLVTITPTFIYYKNGEMKEKYVGMLNDSEKLLEKFTQK